MSPMCTKLRVHIFHGYYTHSSWRERKKWKIMWKWNEMGWVREAHNPTTELYEQYIIIRGRRERERWREEKHIEALNNSKTWCDIEYVRRNCSSLELQAYASSAVACHFTILACVHWENTLNNITRSCCSSHIGIGIRCNMNRTSDSTKSDKTFLSIVPKKKFFFLTPKRP